MRPLAAMLITGLFSSLVCAQNVRAITKLEELPTKYRDLRQTISLTGFDANQIGLIEKTFFKVVSIVDDENCLLSDDNITIWLSDYPTKKLADGDSVIILGAIITGENKHYTDTRGARRTVRSLRLAPLDDADNLEEQIANQIAKERIESTRKQSTKVAEETKLYRVFTDVDGKEFKAKLIEYKNRLVYFERKNNKGELEKFSIAMARLSKSDIKWIQAELKKRSDEAKRETQKKSK